MRKAILILAAILFLVAARDATAAPRAMFAPIPDPGPGPIPVAFFVPLRLFDIAPAGGVVTVGGSSGGGVSLSGTNTWTGAQTFKDNGFVIEDETDGTKEITFSTGGIVTGNTGVLTFAGAASSLNVSVTGSFNIPIDQNFQVGSGGYITQRASQTPDSAFLATTGTSNAWIVAESADVAFDFAHPLQTNPTLFIQSSAQSTTQWLSLTHDGTNGAFAVGTGKINFSSGVLFSSIATVQTGQSLEFGPSEGILKFSTTQTPDTNTFLTGPTGNSWVFMERADEGFDAAHPQQTNPTFFVENAAQDTTQYLGLAYYGTQGRALKTLVETTATSVVRIPVAASTGVGGTVTFTVFAADATDQQTLTGVLQFAAVNKAATETCPAPTLTGTALNAVSTGTLTCTYACDTAPANAVDIQFNCTSSLTQSTLQVSWRVDSLSASEPLPQ